MPKAARNTLAVLAGMVAAIVLVMIGDTLVGIFFMPRVNLLDAEAVERAMPSMPLIAFALLVTGWTLAAAAGAYVATRSSVGRRMWAGLLVTALLLVSTMVNLAGLPHPTWMWIAAIVMIPGAGWVASRAAAGAPEPAVSDVAPERQHA